MIQDKRKGVKVKAAMKVEERINTGQGRMAEEKTYWVEKCKSCINRSIR